VARPYLLTLFDELPDPRVERTRRHKLSDIFIIVLVGVICDCAGWDAMHDMVAAKRADFGDLLELPHGVPSADTLRRTIGALDPKAFSKVFTQWAAALAGVRMASTSPSMGRRFEARSRAGTEVAHSTSSMPGFERTRCFSVSMPVT